MPNAGCTLFAELLCGQLLSQGADVACFPDIYDCTTMVPKRADETVPRGHHYVAKSKLWPIFGDIHGRRLPPPSFIEPGAHVLREWRELGRTVNILFLRDPLANMLSLRRKPFCAACGGMRARFAAADQLFTSVYEAHAESVYWDAVLFAEDMADPAGLLALLAQLLGTDALGPRPVGIATYAARRWHHYKSRPLAANNARLGYRWAGGLPVNGTATGRYALDGAAFRFGTGNAKVYGEQPMGGYHAHRRPSVRADHVLARALAPRLAAAYERSWPEPADAATENSSARAASLRRTLVGALGQHRCHGCKKGGCPRNASSFVGPAPAMFGQPLPNRPRDLRVFFARRSGPPFVPVAGPRSAPLQDPAMLLFAVGHPLLGDEPGLRLM